MQTPVSRSDALSPSFSPIGRVISATCLVWTSLGQGGERTVWLQQITRVPHPTHPTESHARTCAQTHTHTLETSCTQTHQQNRPVSPKNGASFEAHTVCAVSWFHPAVVERKRYHLLCCFFAYGNIWIQSQFNSRCFRVCLMGFLLCKQFQPLWGRGLIDFRASVFTDVSPDGSSRLFWRLEHVVITWPLFKSEK